MNCPHCEDAGLIYRDEGPLRREGFMTLIDLFREMRPCPHCESEKTLYWRKAFQEEGISVQEAA